VNKYLWIGGIFRALIWRRSWKISGVVLGKSARRAGCARPVQMDSPNPQAVLIGVTLFFGGRVAKLANACITTRRFLGSRERQDGDLKRSRTFATASDRQKCRKALSYVPFFDAVVTAGDPG
jgi:hypothetical protein